MLKSVVKPNNNKIPGGFRSGRNWVWVSFLGVLPYHKFHSIISSHSSHSFHFINRCDGASGVVGQHPCSSQIVNKGDSSHLILRPDPTSDSRWGYLFTELEFLRIIIQISSQDARYVWIKMITILGNSYNTSYKCLHALHNIRKNVRNATELDVGTLSQIPLSTGRKINWPHCIWIASK